MASTNTTPIKRPDRVLVLQPWSTATIQTTNRTIAVAASAFSHMVCLFGSVTALSLKWKDVAHVTR